MSAADAATYLDLKPKTMAMHRVYGGGPPFVKTGRIWYFKADLDDWIKARRVTTTAELAAKVQMGKIEKRALTESQVLRAANRRSNALEKSRAKQKATRRAASKKRTRPAVGA